MCGGNPSGSGLRDLAALVGIAAAVETRSQGQEANRQTKRSAGERRRSADRLKTKEAEDDKLETATSQRLKQQSRRKAQGFSSQGRAGTISTGSPTGAIPQTGVTPNQTLLGL